ncbi:hypothetical protein L198_05388 [Cryptococcus wingfieldii CBS 7118]|uniref:Mid2 domain-containing protein n=1 Tax=Cryptococcus wingfieldii CBS 7118 TaxID=1295528 RepID=A0A1E3IY10_9TREE|nr:hypothetical protein L198_05388 [Cryptococcus wingfieldii CBS 7118]ODN93523.1 hypothetical protein L198_05388 [Cryptococcus wingfieldii CBS 7118]
MLTKSLTLLALLALSIVSSRPIDMSDGDDVDGPYLARGGSVTVSPTGTAKNAEESGGHDEDDGEDEDENEEDYGTESVSFTESATSASKSSSANDDESASVSVSFVRQRAIATGSVSVSSSAVSLAASQPVTPIPSKASATPTLPTASAQTSSSSSFAPTPTPSASPSSATHSQSHFSPRSTFSSLAPSGTAINSTLAEPTGSLESFSDPVGVSVSTFIVVFVGTVIALLGMPLLICLAPAVKRGHVANKEWKGKRLGSESYWSSRGSSLRTQSALDSHSNIGSSAGNSDKIPQVATPSTMLGFTPTIVISDRDIERGPFEYPIFTEKAAMTESRA